MTVPMNRRLRRLMLGLLLAGSLPVAHAQGIVIHGHSYHSVDNDRYNNANYGIGYRTADNVAFGVYRNSEYATTVYAAYVWQPSPYFGIAFGGALGYRETPVMPVFMPTLSLPLGPVVFSVGASPMVSGGSGRMGVVVHSMVEVRW
jgi:hypothetical protein